MKIAIATDTNSGITEQSIHVQGLYSLAMPVIIDGQMFFEGIDIVHQQLYQAMRQKQTISSSQPAPGNLVELWDRIFRDGYDEIVYIPMSSGLSGSCQTARQFAAEYGGRVFVVDNHRISVTQQESVMAAHRLAQQGWTAQAIQEHLEAHAYDASIYISVDSMEYLKKGGRITPAAAAFATILNLKPVLTIQGDKLDAFAKVRGMRQAEARMIEAVHQDRDTRFRDVPTSELQIATAGTFEDSAMAEKWRAMVQSEFPDTEVLYVDLPCSIACHVGINSAATGIIHRM